MPFEGSIADQPFMTMNILKVIQATYKQVLIEKQKEMMSKSKVKGPRR